MKKTLCIVDSLQKNYSVYYTQLRIDDTPEILRETGRYEDVRLMSIGPSDFYIFRTDYYKNLKIGDELELELDYYSSFINSHFENMYYDRRHFSDEEVQIMIDNN